MRYAAPVYEYACPKCLQPLGEPCIRVRRVRRAAPEVLLRPHDERYATWHAWEQPRFQFDNVRQPEYECTA